MITSPQPLLVIVTGLPGTGKTYTSNHIATELQLPLIAQDVIKEIMYDKIGIGDVAQTNTFGQATYAIIDHLAAGQLGAGYGLILESNFIPSLASQRHRRLVKQYNARCVQVVCRTESSVLNARLHQRNHADRHPGHNDNISLAEQQQITQQRLDNGEDQPLDIPGSVVIVVDTTDFTTVNLNDIVAQIRSATR